MKRPWSKTEVGAVMKHFKTHISKGHLATKLECERCKVSEHPVLSDRTPQNIRDFVRAGGLCLKEMSNLFYFFTYVSKVPQSIITCLC